LRLQLCWANPSRVTHDALEITYAITSNATHTAAVPSVVSPPLGNAYWKALNAIQIGYAVHIYTQYTGRHVLPYTTAPLAVLSTA
jgi:hypothetical protein